MKKFLVLVYSMLMGLSSFYFHESNPDEKLLRSFQESFPNAQQVAWKELPETFVVNFVEDGIRSQIIYEKSGAFLSSTRYYQEKNLPYYLITNIRKKYPDTRIFGVTEIASSSGIEYYLKMEDSKVWFTIKLDSEGNLRLIEKYKKAY
ncbi:MAG: hypothetical protein ACHQEM_10920 [Chitinophagales bacterium]